MRSPCDFSTKAQECSGIADRELHPPASPVGSPAISLSLPLSLRQPRGIMLMHPATGVLISCANDMLPEPDHGHSISDRLFLDE